jgi:hypothetical protein
VLWPGLHRARGRWRVQRGAPLGFAEASFAARRQLGVESEVGFAALVCCSRDPRVMGLARSML